VTGALILLLILVVAGAMLSAPPVKADEVFRLQTSSAPVGMATDHTRGRYWVLDKTSGRLTLTAVKPDGTVEGSMNSRDSLTNAQALAFESGEAYVGDIGGRRSTVTVYQVTEPWPGTEILKAIAYPLSYPDGAHDAAAILVDANHRISVVTKGPQAGIYQAPPGPTRDAASPLTRVADAPDGVTDGVVLLDGRIVLRTATTVVTLDPPRATRPWAQADDRRHRARPSRSPRPSITAQVLTAAGPGGAVSTVAIPGPAPATPQNPAPGRARRPADAGDDRPSRGEPHLRPDGHDRFGRDRRRRWRPSPVSW
jgi:hypothetical protein